MAHLTAVNDQITDAVAQGNAKTQDAAPGPERDDPPRDRPNWRVGSAS